MLPSNEDIRYDSANANQNFEGNKTSPLSSQIDKGVRITSDPGWFIGFLGRILSFFLICVITSKLYMISSLLASLIYCLKMNSTFRKYNLKIKCKTMNITLSILLQRLQDVRNRKDCFSVHGMEISNERRGFRRDVFTDSSM